MEHIVVLFTDCFLLLFDFSFTGLHIMYIVCIFDSFEYRPFHKTLPRSSAFVNWISVRFYETDCRFLD